jgi:hypothetical protein
MRGRCIATSRVAALMLAASIGAGLAGTPPASAQDTPVPVPVPVPAGGTPTPVPGGNTPTPVPVAAPAAAPAPAQAAPAAANDDPDRNYRIGEIVVGDHVQVDPSLQNYWRPAVVTQVKTMIGGDPTMVRGFVVRDESGNTTDIMATPRMIKK